MTTWTLLFEAPCRGHRYFQDDSNPMRIAVADWSMQLRNRPDTTEDGLLLLNRVKPVRLTPGSGFLLSIPVIDGSGFTAMIGAGAADGIASIPFLKSVGMKFELTDAIKAAIAALLPDAVYFSQCVKAFASPDTHPAVVAARQLLKGAEGEVELDDDVVVSEGDDPLGDMVMTWTWVEYDKPTAPCKFCGAEDPIVLMRPHCGEHVCENCWDDRLKATE